MQTISQFNMTFIEKGAEDPGTHYPWLLAGLADWSTVPNQTVITFIPLKQVNEMFN